MPLVLYIETTDPALASGGNRRITVSQRLSIGRGPDNDLVLNDPSRHLSTNHCVIDFDGNGYSVTDVSRNGTFLNAFSNRLAREKAAPLPEGSVLLVGSYSLKVAAITPSHVAPLGTPSTPDATDNPQSGPAPDDSLFGDPLMAQDAIENDDPVPSSGRPLDSNTPMESRQTDDPLGFEFPEQAPETPLIADDIGLPKVPEPQWTGGSQADHAPADQMYFSPPKVVREKIPDDWDLSELGISIDPALAQSLAAPPPSQPQRAPQARPAPPAGAPSPAMPASPAQAPLPVVPKKTSPDDSAALAGFLVVTGLAALPLSGAEKLRVMQEAGQILVATVAGLLDLLSARAALKEEFHIDRTIVGTTSNNPLKFSAKCADAIRLMLIDRPPGFLPAPQSIEEAFADLKKHQVGLMAGMQATLASVVSRFDPAVLERRIEEHSILSGILPAARKARYWEVFKTCYKEVVGELQDDFHKDLGDKFKRAYNEQVEQSQINENRGKNPR